MAKIESPDDWWQLLLDKWNDILQCFELVGAPITLDGHGYYWADDFNRPIVRHTKALLTILSDAYRDRDNETMLHFLNLCWIAAPDKPYIHDWPSWNHLCDLCSECWVFDPKEMEEYHGKKKGS